LAEEIKVVPERMERPRLRWMLMKKALSVENAIKCRKKRRKIVGSCDKDGDSSH
jgi:hypothetical protein